MVKRSSGRKSSRFSFPGSVMFTRRTATVTISAPDASTARRVSSNDRYLPVPTMSRERYSRPASVKASLIDIASPAPDEVDHLDRVPVVEHGRAVPGARHHGAIHLDRDPARAEAERAHQVGDRRARGERSRLLIQDDLHDDALAETIASHRRADNCGSRLDSGVPVLIFLGLLVQSRIDSNGRPTVAEVSLSALRHNCRRARELCGADVSSFAALVRGLGELRVEGVFSHFASADAVETAAARAQTGRFVRAVETLVAAGLRPPEVHLANSAAVLAAPEARFTMVRPGIMLYGYAPASHLAPRAAVRPAMRLRTRVAQVRRVPPGTPVGYAGTFVTTRPSTIATLPVGYADGYHRLASNRARVAVRGQRVPVAGRVCMDHTMLDVTDLPGVCTGDPAVLFGGTIGADELAAWGDTIADGMWK